MTRPVALTEVRSFVLGEEELATQSISRPWIPFAIERDIRYREDEEDTIVVGEQVVRVWAYRVPA